MGRGTCQSQANRTERDVYLYARQESGAVSLEASVITHCSLSLHNLVPIRLTRNYAIHRPSESATRVSLFMTSPTHPSLVVMPSPPFPAPNALGGDKLNIGLSAQKRVIIRHKNESNFGSYSRFTTPEGKAASDSKSACQLSHSALPKGVARISFRGGG